MNEHPRFPHYVSFEDAMKGGFKRTGDFIVCKLRKPRGSFERRKPFFIIKPMKEFISIERKATLEAYYTSRR
jgi:hypothetical protein